MSTTRQGCHEECKTQHYGGLIPPLEEAWEEIKEEIQDSLHLTEDTVDSECDEHDEEQRWPEGTARQACDDFRIGQENESGAIVDHVFNFNTPIVSHVAENRKCHKSAKQRCSWVDAREDESIASTIMMEIVVAAESEQNAHSNSVWVEYLRAGVHPRLSTLQSLEVRRDVEEESIFRTIQ